jgi:hypothetical protein
MLSKCKEYFFIRVITLRTSYSLLFMMIKWLFKKRQFFLKQNLELFLEPFTLKTYKKRSPHHVLSPMTISPTQEQVISFPRNITRELQDFKRQIALTHIKTIFVFKMQDQDFKIHSRQIFPHQTEYERNERIVTRNQYLFKSLTEHT